MITTASTVIAFIILLPTFGSFLVGLLSRHITNKYASWIVISPLLVSFFLSLWLASNVYNLHEIYEVTYFTWALFPNIDIRIGFMVDEISAFMMLIVLFISIFVHIYSIGYMAHKGLPRFFSYLSGFTAAMLFLVMSNNLLILFFGWECVGLFSYLLIGYHFDRNSANSAGLYAFVMNRIGDVSLLLGIAMVACCFGSVDYKTIFSLIPFIDQNQTFYSCYTLFNPITLIGLFFFIGAMGKSAQVPLHTWLEGSMEGPAPVSALIHSATMVTAGVFLIVRLSPLFICSPAVLSFIMITGSITSFSMSLVAAVQNDIKKIIAYCTLSQLGYMILAVGASAFSFSLFHLMTHAIFKSLLFLSTGLVVLLAQNEQNIYRMSRNGLCRSMPTVYYSITIGALTLCGVPPFAGFFSKDLIIEAVQSSTVFGHNFAYYLAIFTTFFTTFYIFRMIFVVFHSSRGFQYKAASMPYKYLYMVIPLIVLSVASILSGMLFFRSSFMLNESTSLISFFGSSLPSSKSLFFGMMHYNSYLEFFMHSLQSAPFWFSVCGFGLAYVFYVMFPMTINSLLKKKFILFFYQLFEKKYFFNELYNLIFVRGTLSLSVFLWQRIDVNLINKFFVQRSVNFIHYCANFIVKLQRGYICDYALILLLGLTAMIVRFVFFNE